MDKIGSKSSTKLMCCKVIPDDLEKKFKVALVGVTGFKAAIARLLNPASYFARSKEDAFEWLVRE